MREGWEMKKLKDLTIKIGSGATPRGGQSSYKESGISLIRSMNVYDKGFQENKLAFIDEKQAEKLKNVIVEEDDVLLNITGASVARCCMVPKKILPARVNQHVSIIRIKKGILLKEFLHFYLISKDVKGKLLGIGEQGSTRQAITKTQLENFEILFPKSISEQKKIVTILDQAFAAIDQAKANVEKNLQNAKELFQSKLNEVFSQKGDGWKEKTLKEITTKIGSGSTPRGGQASYKESGISLVRSMNVHDYGFKERKLAFIDDTQAAKLKNVTLQQGDVLLNITGASVARCCIIPKKYLPARVNQHVSIIRLIKEIVIEEFLRYSLISKSNKDELLGIGEQGSTRQSITKVQIENFSITFPKSIEVQKEIVKELNVVRTKSESLVNVYQAKLESLEELKKSILQKAFSGELTQNKVPA